MLVLFGAYFIYFHGSCAVLQREIWCCNSWCPPILHGTNPSIGSHFFFKKAKGYRDVLGWISISESQELEGTVNYETLKFSRSTGFTAASQVS